MLDIRPGWAGTLSRCFTCEDVAAGRQPALAADLPV